MFVLDYVAGLRKLFVVYGNDKLHVASNHSKYISAARIISASVANVDGTPVALSTAYSDLVTIHYPKKVGL